jgi:hypothetical protein
MTQQLQALAIANRVRSDGVAVQREIAAGTLTVVDALEDPRASGLHVGRLLCAQRGYGPGKAHRLLGSLGIWPTRRVRDLTERQRKLIAETLR